MKENLVFWTLPCERLYKTAQEAIIRNGGRITKNPANAQGTVQFWAERIMGARNLYRLQDDTLLEQTYSRGLYWIEVVGRD